MSAVPCLATPREAASARAASDRSPRMAAELVACGSLEMGADRPRMRADRRAAAGGHARLRQPSAAPRPGRHAARADALREAGWSRCRTSPRAASPRARRRKRSSSRPCGEAGVAKVLLIGGDVPEPAGPMRTARPSCAMACSPNAAAQVGLPGYPEGHPRIPSGRAGQQRSAEKLDAGAHARARRLHGDAVLFAPGRMVEYCADLARARPGCRSTWASPGPTSPVALLRFAQRCGVSASLRALQAPGHGRGAAGHPHRSQRAAHRAGALLPRRQRRQRGGRAPVQLRRRRRAPPGG